MSTALERHVRHLVEDIGERNLRRPEALDAAATWIDSTIRALGLTVSRQSYEVDGHQVHNIECVLPSISPTADVVVVGAHYDSAIGTPGANDNASGVATLIEIARRFSSRTPARELRLVWFTNEEPPHFHTDNMGSLRYARHLAGIRRKVVGMLSLETIGYYSNRAGSQRYPAAVDGMFPSTGNFLAFVGNSASKDLVRQTLGAFRKRTPFPSEGVVLADRIQGAGWSDHWSFWQIGVPAIMVTDTALFRYPHYHKPTDTPDEVDYARLARVTNGLTDVLQSILQAGR